MAYDLAIVGAGPAGAAAALTARLVAPDADVVLLERAAFPRDKPCGDALSPDAVAELAKLGAAGTVQGFAPVERLRLRSPGGIEVVDAPPAIGYVVPRLVFDERLASAARDTGIDWRQATVRGVDPAGDRVTLQTSAGDMTARAVIGADGANSVVRRGLTGAAPAARHMGVAVRGYAPAPGGPRELHLIWEAADALAYAWSFPIDDRRCNVGYGVFGTATPPRRAHLVERMTALLSNASSVDSVRGHRLPLSSGGARLGAGRVLLAGDAASLINPLTGEGIYYALLSGRLAASAALRSPGAPSSAYRATLYAALGAHLRSTRWLARLAAKPRVLDQLVRAASASPATLELLADLAFGKGTLAPVTALTLAGGLARSLPSRATPRRTT